MFNCTIMQKYCRLCLSVFAVGMLVFVSSCDKDDEPTKYALSFSDTELTAKESDLTIEIEVTLDKPAPEDVTVKYKLEGSAFDDIRAGAQDEDADYTVEGDYEEIEIKEGETSAKIVLIPFSDEFVEEDETIEISITEVGTENIDFSTTESATVTLGQEDGMAIFIDWPKAGVDGVADMDMIVRIAENDGTLEWNGILTGSAFRGFEANYEFVFIPKTYVGELFDLGYVNTIYGLSYTYYDGTLEKLDFTSTFIEVINGEPEGEAGHQSFEQSYTKANLNKWVGQTYPTIIAQTFVNNNGTFSDISPISVPDASSRSISTSANELVKSKVSKFRVGTNVKHREIPEKFLRVLSKRKK